MVLLYSYDIVKDSPFKYTRYRAYRAKSLPVHPCSYFSNPQGLLAISLYFSIYHDLLVCS